MKPINYGKLIHIANSTNWNEILSIQDPEFAVEKLIELIQECTDKATTINNNKRYNKSLVPRKKWITSAIMKSCQTKETLYTLWRSNPDNVTLKSDYKTYVKLLDKVIKDAKFKHEKDQVESCGNNPKKLLKFINSSLSKKKKEVNNINSLTVNNAKLDNKCNKFK